MIAHPTPRYPFELYDIPGAWNVRDLGGYRGREGRPVQKGCFIRSGGLHELSAAGVAGIRALGVDHILDLRSVSEITRMPNILRDDSAIQYTHIPLLDHIQSDLVSGEPPLFPDSLETMYVELLEDNQADFRRIMQALADPAYATTLFHCTAGKDRTGLTAMLLLGLAGVSRADILSDYTPSAALAPPMENVDNLPEHLFQSPRKTMETALDHLETTYGGILPYLSHVGVDATTRDALLHKLLDPSEKA